MSTKLLVVFDRIFLDFRAGLKYHKLHSGLQHSSWRYFYTFTSKHRRTCERVLARVKSSAFCNNNRSNSNNWQNNMQRNNDQRKTIPKLVYLHNPFKYLVTKANLLKLRYLWDRNFKEQEFIRGSKQAAIVITDIIRNQSTGKVSKFTTPVGFQQITRDMLLSRNDSRLRLVNFETEHLRKAIPMKVATRKNFGRRYCFIDMLFVGLRNTKDFESSEELLEINEVLRKLDADMRVPIEITSVPHRIVFAEIFMRFRRDYTLPQDNTMNKDEDKDWSVSFYKILTFDILNYDPKP
ncbi:uncharacterized protein [Eurosta solidaginis]|uniref:uncharacterized protein n=1 Tax=Eurosta solidaginis TaxID=178769 RepID=UPI0035313E0E